MYCDNCTSACPIYSCYTNLYVGKISSLSTAVKVLIQNVATGRTVIEEVTTSGAGVVLLTAGTWSKMFNTNGSIKIRVMINGEAQDITMYDTTSTFIADTYNCITFGTMPLYESDGDMYSLTNQYLLKAG